MEVGRQFEDACSRSVPQTHDGASRQTARITQFGVGNQSIVGRHTYFHRLTGEIPRAVCLNTRCKRVKR